MRYKIISLILIIPLILMVCIFSASKVASQQVDISVSDVTLFHDKQEVINLAEGNNLQINAQVMPINASNKGLIYSYEQVGETSLPNLEIDEFGLITANGYGSAKIVVTTKDGAYKKSFLLEVTSTVATDIEVSLSESENIIVGDSFSVIGKAVPSDALDKNIKYYSSDNSVVSVNQLTGECKAISSGKATLKAVLENGLSGKIEKQIEVIVYPTQSSNPITFNGSKTLEDNVFSENFSVVMEVNFADLYILGERLTEDDIILSYNSNLVENVELVQLENNNGIYKYKLNINGLTGEEFNLTASLNFDNYRGYQSVITLKKIVELSQISLNLTNFKEYIKLNSTNSFQVSILPQDFTGYEVNTYFVENNITLLESGGVYYYKGTAVGENTLNVEISYQGEVIKTFTNKVEVLNPPTSLYFLASTESYGIEDLLTIGSEKIQDGEYCENQTELEFTTSIDRDFIEFKSSDENIAKFIDGKLVIVGEGKVTITATELQSKLLGLDLKATTEIRCVKGVEVGSYNDLVKATEEGKQVVLVNNIMLGEQLIEVSNSGTTKLLKTANECAKILKSEVKQIETTAEWNYYKNNPDYKATTPPKINYIIKFTNNCYGNGYSLNANNITNMVDGTNSLYSFAVFRGPLNLVAIPEVAIKAQDNISFIAGDNVMLNNVELIGANLNGLETADLNSLDYVGTVLEVMGDNVKIVNSRVKNGRNCVRVYGKESGNYDKINVLIESSVISNAREFLVKMGTNAKLYGEFSQTDMNLANGISDTSIWENCAPKIEGYRHLNDGSLSEEEYNALVEEYKNDGNFQDLIKTNLTIKNSVLHTSGLFSIGLESSFAGPCLDGGTYNSWNFADYGWIDIAGTSYPTMLNLEGSVKIYDWKKLSNIDSSILIEGSLFNFDIAEMIENCYNDGQFTDLITIVDGEKYAHGGVVMYGGGKNYCLINSNLEGVEDFNNYSLNLDSLNTSLTTMIKYASGKENFRALMYGKNSEFNYYKQVNDLQSGDAYKDLGKYIF